MRRVYKVWNKRDKKNYKRLYFILGMSFCLLGMGCKKQVKVQSDMQNVEQRDYATILMVSQNQKQEGFLFDLGIAQEKKVGEKSQREDVVSLQADNLQELMKKYRDVKGKTLSLVHLKVILLTRQSQEVLEGQGDILYQLNQNREIAKTCPVLFLTQQEAFKKYVKKAKEPVGLYVENLIRVARESGKEVPGVKNYLQLFQDGKGLEVYDLAQTKNGWKIKCVKEIQHLVRVKIPDISPITFA